MCITDLAAALAASTSEDIALTNSRCGLDAATQKHALERAGRFDALSRESADRSCTDRLASSMR